MKESITRQVATAVNEGWINGGSFLGSILSGALLGYLADRWLGTEPWLLITGILLGVYSAFVRLWQWTKEGEDAGR